MGYRQPVITLRFDELVEDGDTCHVIIRNPKLMPADEFKAMAGPDGEESGTGTMDRSFGLIARMVIAWRVWDPTVPIRVNEHTGELIRDEETEPRLLPLPATPELVAKLPQMIALRLMNEVGDAVNPQRNQAETTGSPS